MKNLLKTIGIVFFTMAIIFSFIGCPPEPTGGKGNVWEAPNGIKMTIDGNNFTRTVPGEGLVSARSNVRGSITRTATEMNITVSQYSINGGNTWLTKAQFTDQEIIATVGQAAWNTMNNEQRNLLRTSAVYANSNNLRSLPVSIKMAYTELPDFNQLVVTQTVTTTTLATPVSTNNDTVVYQKAGTRVVPVDLEGRWVNEDNPATILLNFTVNQLTRTPTGGGSATTSYVKETDGKLELSSTPGNFTSADVFCESYTISNGVLTFTGGTSATSYSGVKFVKYVFPPASITPIQLTANQWGSGNIPTPTSEQYFRFTATAATQYIHFVTGTINSFTGINIQVLDSTGTTIGTAQTNLYGTSLNRYTTRQLTTGQTYYIRVWPYSSTGTGTYNILFNASETTPNYTWTPPNNATPLTAGTWVDGSIATVGGDAWYVFDAVTLNTYYIWWNDSGEGNGLKTQNISVTAFNAAGTQIFTNTNSSWTTARTISPLPANSKIYLQVSATATPGGTYGIVYTANEATRPVAPFIPPDTVPLTENLWANGNITTTGGIQFFSFTATAETQYIHFNTSGTLTDVNVRVIDSTGTTIGAAQTNLYGTGSGSRTDRTLTVGETYYIRVWPWSSTSTGGTYYIGFNTTTTVPSWPIPANTTLLTNNTWRNDEITAASGGAAWYSFPVTNGNTYNIWWNESGTSNGDGTKTLDVSVLGQYDDGTVALATQTNGWGTARTITANRNGTVYLRVVPSTAGNTGTYAIIYSSNLTIRPAEIPTTGVTPLTNNTWTDGEITTANQAIWYSFPVSNGTYRIWWNESGSNGNSTKTLDVNVIGYYSDGSQAFASTATAWGTPVSHIVTASSETLYLRVSASNSSNTGTFGIVFNTTGTRPDAPITIPSTVLTEGTWANGEITTAGGVVWYSFPVTSGTYRVWWNESGNNGNGTKTLDVSVTGYYASNGNQAFTNSTAWGTAQNITGITTADTIYLRVSAANSSNTGTFGIVFSTETARPAAPINIPDAIELNLNTWADGEVAAASGGVVWYSSSVTSGTAYRVWLNEIDADGNGLKNLNVNVTVYYADTGNIACTINAAWQNSPDNNFTPTANGTVYIKVTPSSANATGTFGIVLSTGTTMPTAPFDPPNVVTPPLTEGSWASGNITTAGGVQWFSFTATATTQYIHFSTQGSLKDVYIRVLDSTGITVGTYRTNLYGSTLSTNRTLTVGETYYIRVWPFSSSDTGNYLIVFNNSTTTP